MEDARTDSSSIHPSCPSPFVKWAGGKTGIAEDLLHFVPTGFSRYYEPFLGAGALFFALYRHNRRFTAFLSDTNKDLINTYRVVRDHTEKFITGLSKTQREYDGARSQSEYYYQQRNLRPSTNNESASRFVFLNKTCYNGLYRVNSKNEFNVPFGRYKNPRLFNSDNLRAVSNALRQTRASLETTHYEKAVEKCVEGDLIYFDPPYQPVSKTSSFTSYTPNGFSKTDQVHLATIFRELSDRGCNVILSNSNTPLVRKLYQGFNQELVEVKRSINSIGSKRKGFTELIVSNCQTKNNRQRHQ
jgi:DNA adenine methylase